MLNSLIHTKNLHNAFELLDEKISSDIEQPPHKFTLIAVGGTALTLKDIKISTTDVDFMFKDIGVEKMKKYSLQIAKEHKIKIDVWQFPFVFSTALMQDAPTEPYSAKYTNFDVEILNNTDIAVSKLARFNEADREDIDAIINRGTNMAEIIKRFKQTLDSGGFANKSDALRNIALLRAFHK